MYCKLIKYDLRVNKCLMLYVFENKLFFFVLKKIVGLRILELIFDGFYNVILVRCVIILLINY